MFRIIQELKFLPIKKKALTQQLYHLLIKSANTWHKSWPTIQNNLEDKLHSFIQIRYENLQQKNSMFSKGKKQNFLKSPTTYTKTRYSHNFIQERKTYLPPLSKSMKLNS